MNVNNIKIKNFKSLKDVKIILSNLTLITGVNSAGKSSFIEVLLLFIKANQKLDIKNSGEMFYQEAKNEDIILNCNDLTLRLFTTGKYNYPLQGLERKELNLFSSRFQYINTNRVAPQKSYSISDDDIKNNSIGSKGEYTAHYLNANKNSKIIDNLRHKNAKTNRLIENISLWLGDISGGIEIGTEIYRDLEKVSLFYIYNYQNKKTDKYTPLNVGFGLTYVLPIIVAILKAKPNDLLIIENPESHLHPKAQSKIAELCAIASANGVQMIVETHSDHFLNGIRVATKKGILTPEQSNIYYFRKDKDELETKIDRLSIDEEGRINESWPKGFFDEYRNQLDELLW